MPCPHNEISIVQQMCIRDRASRSYIEQMWAEAMVIYNSKKYQLALSKEMEQYLKEFQKQFMPEDTKAGMIQGFLDGYSRNMVCSKMLYKEALNHPFDEPKQWEIREINDIMNNSVVGWKQFTNPRHFAGYGRQKGWERDNQPVATGTNTLGGFTELTEEEIKQMELPF